MIYVSFCWWNENGNISVENQILDRSTKIYLKDIQDITKELSELYPKYNNIVILGITPIEDDSESPKSTKDSKNLMTYLELFKWDL
jgi:hypothetical protein